MLAVKVTPFEDVGQWVWQVENAVKLLNPGEIIKFQRQLVFMALGAAVVVGGRPVRISGVVLMTPVDTGRARSSWHISIGNSPKPKNTRHRGQITASAASKMKSLGAYQTVWIASSLPYIHLLEYGGYPDPVARGTWDRKMKKWVIRSSGGYSKQAPNGMVRVTVGGILAALGG